LAQRALHAHDQIHATRSLGGQQVAELGHVVVADHAIEGREGGIVDAHDAPVFVAPHQAAAISAAKLTVWSICCGFHAFEAYPQRAIHLKIAAQPSKERGTTRAPGRNLARRSRATPTKELHAPGSAFRP